jgi:hypothetical protein
MTREQYFGLKSELKEIARQIRLMKSEFKTSQKDFTSFTLKNGSFKAYYDGKINSTQWEAIRTNYNSIYNSMEKGRDSLKDLKCIYRYKHIVYCLARGKTMLQIEQLVRKGNEIDMHILDCYLKDPAVVTTLEAKV